jgi:hypothetical protein
LGPKQAVHKISCAKHSLVSVEREPTTPMNLSHLYRRFYRWLTKRYYSEDRAGAKPTATVRLAKRDPLFWLWAVLPRG